MGVETGCRHNGIYGERKIPGIGQFQESMFQLGNRQGTLFCTIYLDPSSKDKYPEEGGQIRL